MSTVGTLYDETIKNGFAKLLSIQYAPAGTASINFVSEFSSAYDAYLFDIDNIFMARDDCHFILRVSIDGGASWRVDNYYWSCSTLFSNQNPNIHNAYGSATLGGVHLTWMMLTHASIIGHPLSGRVRFFPNNENSLSHVLWRTVGIQPSLYTQVNMGGGFWPYGNFVNGIQFLAHAGTISGNIRMYGMRTGA